MAEQQDVLIVQLGLGLSGMSPIQHQMALFDPRP